MHNKKDNLSKNDEICVTVILKKYFYTFSNSFTVFNDEFYSHIYLIPKKYIYRTPKIWVPAQMFIHFRTTFFWASYADSYGWISNTSS